MPEISRRELLGSGLAALRFISCCPLGLGAHRGAVGRLSRSGFGRGAGGSCAARAIAVRLRLEVPVRPRRRPGPRSGLRHGPGRFCQDRRIRLRQGQIRRLEVARAEPAARLGGRAALCARRGAAIRMATSPWAAAIRRPAWAGTGASSIFLPAIWAGASRSSSTAPSATCWSSSTAASSAATTMVTRHSVLI